MEIIEFSTMNKNKPSYAFSFIKWAGGKGRLLSKLREYLPKEYAQYHEPFLGSGAIFFHLRPRVAFLSDINEELITTYCAVRDHAEEVLDKLKSHECRHLIEGARYYYGVRKQDIQTLDAVEKAARFIYLNKTCFNGIYHENKKGMFNVPLGKHLKPNIVNEYVLKSASEALKNCVIRSLYYNDALDDVKQGDFVFLDPPYTGHFTSYHKNGFDWSDQVNLSNKFRYLHNSGAYLMMTNGADDRLAELYHGFRLTYIQNRVYLSGKPEGRKESKELLILNYDPVTQHLLNV